MAKRKTQDEFDKEIKELVGNEYTFLERYINTSTKIKVKHNKCNRIYEVKPNSFLGGNRCPYCCIDNRKGKSFKKFTKEDWKNHFDNNLSKDYEQITEFKGLKSKITMKHKKCGNIITINAQNFKSNKPCRHCSQEVTNKKQRKTHEEFCNEVSILGKGNFEVKEQYKGNHKPIKLKHIICNRCFMIAPNDFKKHRKCPHCSQESMKLTQKDWDKRVFDLVGNEYTFLEKYIDTMTKIKVRHNKCNHVYSVRPNNFVSGYRCPLCKASLGEQNIIRYLEKNNIEYIHQYSFKNLKGVRNELRYDFYLPKYNLLIEFQGIQHYKPIKFFGGLEKFKQQVKTDKIKKEYAINSMINFLEVPFYVSNENLINEKLNYELAKIL